nr:MAG TPA: hypothetical protein [Siphoviridae sp. ctvS314]
MMRRSRGSSAARRRAVVRSGPRSWLRVLRAAVSTSSAGMLSASARLLMVVGVGTWRIWSAAIWPMRDLERPLASARCR